MPDRAGTRNLFDTVILPTLPIPGRQLFRGASKRLHLYEDFRRLPKLNATLAVTSVNPTDGNTAADMAAALTTNRHFEVDAEAGWADTDATWVGGRVRLFTPAATPATNDYAGIRPHLDTGLTIWASSDLFGSEDEVEMEMVVSFPAITEIAFLFGLKEDTSLPADIAVVGSDDNASFIHFDNDSATSTTNFTCVENINTADTVTDSGVILEASTDYHLRLAIDSNRATRFYINERQVHVGSPLKAAVDFVPFVAIMTDATATKKGIDLCPLYMSRAI